MHVVVRTSCVHRKGTYSIRHARIINGITYYKTTMKKKYCGQHIITRNVDEFPLFKTNVSVSTSPVKPRIKLVQTPQKNVRHVIRVLLQTYFVVVVFALPGSVKGTT